MISLTLGALIWNARVRGRERPSVGQVVGTLTVTSLEKYNPLETSDRNRLPYEVVFLAEVQAQMVVWTVFGERSDTTSSIAMCGFRRKPRHRGAC